MFTILRQRDFGLLWFAGLISITGDLALTVALPLHIYKLTDSTLATAGAGPFRRRPVGPTTRHQVRTGDGATAGSRETAMSRP